MKKSFDVLHVWKDGAFRPVDQKARPVGSDARSAPRDVVPRPAAFRRTPRTVLPATLPASAVSFEAAYTGDPKLLVRMPTRSRAQQALEVLAKYRQMAGIPIAMEVVVDVDDASMQHPSVLCALRDLDCTFTVGAHRSKIEAVNGGRVDDWDILVLASDDMVPVSDGWAARVIADMRDHFPQLDGALHYNDGNTGNRLCTLPIQGRRLHEQFGYVYHPEYLSLWCDNEQTDVLRAMGRLAYVSAPPIIEHRHPATGKARSDGLYARNETLNSRDKETYLARRAREFDMPAMRLSILIASLPARGLMLRRLLDHVWAQALKRPRQVEVLIDVGAGSTGCKRQRLLDRARGAFVAFVDDDDWVAHDYVERVLGAIDKKPAADCVEFHVAMLSDGKNYVGHCSQKYLSWSMIDGIYTRCPNHLSPVRRELALRAGFPDKTIGEDYDYSMRLRPFLASEAPMSSAPLYFYFPGGGA